MKIIYILLVVLVFVSAAIWFYSGTSYPTNPGPYKDKIEVYDVVPNQVLDKSPAIFHGRARGTWYFEASFPVQIVDINGNVLGTGIAQAQDEWMTENYVDFIVEVTFSEPATQTGLVKFIKDNPSGMSEFEDAYIVPVKFK